MNISDWPIGRIMALPDHLFGRRFIVCCHSRVDGQTTLWDISEIQFPELFVIWEAHFLTWETELTETIFRVALGDQLPANVGMMDALEPLFPGLGISEAEPRRLYFKEYQRLYMRNLRIPVRASGRRLVCEFHNTFTHASIMGLFLTVSGVPKEIPDCLISV